MAAGRPSQAAGRLLLTDQQFAKLRSSLMQSTSSISKNEKSNTRKAAVLLPFCEKDGSTHVLFTKRSFKLRKHKGEISFPGGICDRGENPVDTALRETWEELGINRDHVEVLGMLQALPDRERTTSIRSVLGRVSTPGDIMSAISINPDEVAHAFTVPLRDLLIGENWRYTRFRQTPALRFPVFACSPEPIWGLTAFILQVAVNIIRDEVLKP